jgi:hypothetical protein
MQQPNANKKKVEGITLPAEEGEFNVNIIR